MPSIATYTGARGDARGRRRASSSWRVGAAAALALALALAARPASAQVTTMGDGLTPLSPTTRITACPGGSAVRADYFTLQASQAGDWVRAVKVALSPTGAYAGVAQVDIRDSAGTTTYGSIVPPGDGFDVQLATTFAVSVASPTEYSIWVTPKGFGAIPTALANGTLTAKMILVFNRFARTGADTTSAPLQLDSKPPAEVGWTSLAATTSQVALSWGMPSDAQSVLVLRDTKPVTDAPVAPAAVTAYGTVGQTFSGGTSTIRFAGSAAPWQVTDTGLTSGKSYYYEAFTRDQCGNWSAGEPIGPVVASGGTTEGDPTPSSLKPMVGIVNPIPGGVVGNQFKVQARVYSPKNGSNVQNITTVTISVTKPDGTAATSGSLTENAQYGTATDSGVFEPSPVLSLSPGQYVIQVTAANASGSAKSAVVPITVGAAAGDGNILRRDDSSQLCSDCHALPTHSSEATSTKYGAWYAGCRSCHQPHGTTNASLVAREIRPPQVAAQLPPTRAYYSTTTGYDPTAGATNTTTLIAATFANGDRTGPCQVCHTRTNFYRRAGAAGNGGPANLAGGADHYTTSCTTCHKHTAGFGASCTSCHGTAGRVGPAGSDALVAAAPPQDHLGNTLTTSPGVGVHLAHVTGTTWRSTPLACNECHPIPNSHDGVTETQFTGTLSGTSYDWAGAVGGTPTYSRPSCSSMYCHGDFRGGNNAATPSWTAAGSVVCGSCHGIPPANSAHSGVTTSCAGCHPAGYDPTHVNSTTHLDGQLEAAGCNGCHGDPSRTSAVVSLDATFTDAYVSPMPPKDHNGNTATTALGVGAHNSHVNTPTSLAMPIRCETCHGPLPTDSSHSSQPTVVLAAVGYTSPTCTNSCHGTSAMGGTLHAPTWNTVNGTQDACGTCHGLPPPVTDKGHPQNTGCGTCHPGYTSAAVVQATHVNGVTDVNTSSGCARCHGVLENAVANTDLRVAPGYVSTTVGVDTHGNTAATVVTVGAHDAHVRPAGSANLRTPLTCDSCHGALPATGTVTHANGTIDLGWSALASSTYGAGNPTAFNSTWEASPTCLVYCHSNASPLGGKQSTARSPAWTSTANLACDGCHAFQADKTLSASSTNLSHGHYKHTAAASAGGYGFDCAQCHKTVATGQAGNPASGAIVAGGQASHVDGQHTVAFDAAVNPGSPAYSQAATTCSSTYCHSNGTSATSPPANTSIAWTATSTCGSCHAAGAAMATGQHQKHVNNAAVLASDGSYHCGDCHSTTVLAGTDATMIGTGATPTHLNRVKDVVVAARGGQTSGSYASPTCASVYCHSSGQRSASRTSVSVAWTDSWTAPVCNRCHGTSNAYGYPDYANGGAGTATANSHAAHVSKATDCFSCHRATTTTGTAIVAGGLHTNGAIDVSFSTTIAGATASYAAGASVAGTCSSVTCHGGNAVTWGDTTVSCRSCHFGASGAGVNSDVDDYVYGNGTVAKVDPDDWASYGHGATTAFAESGNPAPSFDAGGVDGCLYCHDTAANGVAHGDATNPFRLKNVSGASGKAGVCLACHGTGSAGVTVSGTLRNGTKKINAVHYGADHATYGTGGGQYCWDCHDPHGDYNYPAGQRLAYMIQLQPVMNHATTTTSTDWGIPRSSADLAPIPDFRKNRSPAGNSTSWDWTDFVSSTSPAPYRGVCQVCHTNTTHFNQSTSEDTHPGGALCTTCHAHDQGTTDAFKGNGGDCLGCHGATGAAAVGKTHNLRPVAADFSKTSHHAGNGGATMGGTLTNRDCVVCHAEGTITSGATDTTALHQNGKIDLRDADSTTGGYFQYDAFTIRALGTGAANSGNATWKQEMSGRSDDLVGTSNVACNPTGTGCSKGLDRFCLSCHDADGASASYTLGDPGATALNPFSDTAITNEVDQVDRTRVVDIASRVDVTARTASGSRVTAADRDYTSLPAGVVAVRSPDTRNDPPEGIFSRHAIRGLATSVYGTTNANWDTTTYWNRASVTWSSTSVMGCADCHTSDGVNTTNGNAHGSNSQYLLKNATGNAVTGADSTTYVCAQCHAASNYAPSTHMGTSTASNCFTDSTGLTGATRATTSKANVYGMACTTCHGGGGPSRTGAPSPNAGTTLAGGFGTIHGTSQVLGQGSGGTSGYRPAYRFMNGNSMRYYDPGDWVSGGRTAPGRTCITLSSGDSWGQCTQHTGTSRSATVGNAEIRPLSY